MCEKSDGTTYEQWTLFAEVIRAKPIVLPAGPTRRVSAFNSCKSLMKFARAVFSAKIRQSHVKPRHGRGGDFGSVLNNLGTLCCPSDSGRVALALTTGETGCSCTPNYPTLLRADATRGPDKRLRKGSGGPNLRAVLGHPITPAFAEEFMGFPDGWTDCKDSETLFTQTRLNGSVGGL